MTTKIWKKVIDLGVKGVDDNNIYMEEIKGMKKRVRGKGRGKSNQRVCYEYPII